MTTKIKLSGQVESVTFRGGAYYGAISLLQKYEAGGYQNLGTITIHLTKEQAQAYTSDRLTKYLDVTIEEFEDDESDEQEPE